MSTMIRSNSAAAVLERRGRSSDSASSRKLPAGINFGRVEVVSTRDQTRGDLYIRVFTEADVDLLSEAIDSVDASFEPRANVVTRRGTHAYGLASIPLAGVMSRRLHRLGMVVGLIVRQNAGEVRSLINGHYTVAPDAEWRLNDLHGVSEPLQALIERWPCCGQQPSLRELRGAFADEVSKLEEQLAEAKADLAQRELDAATAAGRATAYEAEINAALSKLEAEVLRLNAQIDASELPIFQGPLADRQLSRPGFEASDPSSSMTHDGPEILDLEVDPDGV